MQNTLKSDIFKQFDLNFVNCFKNSYLILNNYYIKIDLQLFHDHETQEPV